MRHATFDKSLTILVFILVILGFAADPASAETLSTDTTSFGVLPKFLTGALLATFIGAKLFRANDHTL